MERNRTWLGQKNCPMDLSLRVRRELALGACTGEADTSLGPTAGEDRAAILGTRAGQKAELADTTFLRGLECSFHGDS